MVIINSDDFGINVKTNKAIIDAFSQGLISSTTALVNFDEGLNDAVKCVENGKIDPKAIGIHLNLTQGIPITKNIRENSLFCRNGSFNRIRHSTSIFKLDSYSKECVHEELEAQIIRFKSKFGFYPSHIDSHHHIHTEWGIINCVMKVAKNHRISSIRLARNTGASKNWIRKVYRNIINHYLKLNGFIVTDKFGSINDIIYSGLVQHKDYEIMVHAVLSSSGDEIIDLDNEILKDKISKLFQRNTLNLSNYYDFKTNKKRFKKRFEQE
jgi:predicted glycoside hydrolase/deacetylase ChbG (UPF0249 family)